MTAVATRVPAEAAAKKGIDGGVMAVFAGLMLGSLIASLNMTLVAPALPTIVSELGGIAEDEMRRGLEIFNIEIGLVKTVEQH